MSDELDGTVTTHTEIQGDPMDVIAQEGERVVPEAEQEAAPVEAEAQPEAQEQEQEPQPEAETAQEKADRLSGFRHEGKLDEEKLLGELDGMSGAAAFGREVDQILTHDVEARVAYLKALKKAGRLPPQAEARLKADMELLSGGTEKAQAQPETPERKLPTREDARKTYRRLMAEGREEEAFDFMADWTEAVADQKLRPVNERMKQEEERRASETRASIAQTQVRETIAAFPDLFDKNGVINNPTVHAKMRELHEEVGPKVSLKRLTELALKELGMWKAPAAKKPAPPAARAPMKQAAPSPVRKSGEVVEQGYVMTSTPIEGEE